MAQPHPLDAADHRDLVRRALAEDVAGGDATTNAIIGEHALARGTFLAKSRCTLAGIEVALEVFSQLDADITAERHFGDGDECAPGAAICTISGRARALLTGERTALNFLQHLSGIATLTRQFVQASGGKIIVLDTRKTIPMLRGLEKYAVRMGGATNHRLNLNDGVMIKDNHILLGGGITHAVAAVRARVTKTPLEVEVETLEEVDEALAAGADILLLDNMAIDHVREAVRRCRGRAKTEISGGVTLARMPEIAETGADFVSVGALTHSAPAADISFEIERA